MRNFIIDTEHEDDIRTLITRRKDGAFVMPLYIRMYNDRIDLRDYKEINNFNLSGYKMGFGAMNGLLIRQAFPMNMIDHFDIVHQFTKYDYDKNISVGYYVFETSAVDEELTKHPMMHQINYYYDLFGEALYNQQQEHRKKLLEEMLNS